MNKTIILEGIEYDLIPKIKYKNEDWIWFVQKDKTHQIRKVVSEKLYNEFRKHGIALTDLDEMFGIDNWMTEGAVEENKLQILRKATKTEIKLHLKELAKRKGLIKGAKVKRLGVLDTTTFVTIVQEDDDYYSEQDEYCKSGIILYSKGQWVTKIEEPIFTFGGYGVSFKRIEKGEEYNFRTIEVTCKGETGTNSQISCILTHYFRPMPFGSVFIKKFTVQKFMPCNGEYLVNDANNDINTINTITIGCLTGTYKELKNIFEECQRLLK